MGIGFEDWLQMYNDKYYKEAENDPPDINSDNQNIEDSSPPDMPTGGDNNSDDMSDQAPPDMDFNDDESFENIDDESNEEFDTDGLEDLTNNQTNMQLSEKISAIMNQKLYQRFLSLLNKVQTQLTAVKKNSDILFVLSDKMIDTLKILERLDENIHLYLKHKFTNTDFSDNLLFFNKCLNLLQLANIMFDKNIHKGIKEQQ